MYPEIFNKCIAIILKNEGGYVNNPVDHGKETNMGISKANYPMEDIKSLTKEKAIALYYRDYYVPMNLELLNDEDLILQVFDHGVLSGPRTAIKLLQRIVGVKDDGVLGPQTIGAIAAYSGDIGEEYIKRRKLFYITIAQNKPSQRIFLDGWINRVNKTKFT